MWIRTQDKRCLIYCNNFSIEGYDNCSFDIETIETMRGVYTPLGSYSSEVKALKVLDEIQEMIIGKKKSYYTTSGYGKQLVKNEYYENTSNMVYQMPQDDEVDNNDK